jgi:exonuclease III
LLDWKPISERIITAGFQGNIRNVSIVQWYSPTEQAEMEEKKRFYTPLQETLNKIKRKDMVFAMGDLNAKAGKIMSDWSR